MKRSGAAVLAGFVLIALFIVVGIYLGREVVQLYGDLGAKFLAFSLLTIVTALILAGGLRRGGDSAARMHRLQNKADAYAAYLDDLRDCRSLRSTTARALLLWGSPGVMRVIDAKPGENDGDASFRDWLTLLIREMRQDTGQSNIQLKLESIVDALSISASENGDTNGCKLS